MEHWAKMGLILLGTLTLIPALLASRTDNATSFYSPTTPPLQQKLMMTIKLNNHSNIFFVIAKGSMVFSGFLND